MKNLFLSIALLSFLSLGALAGDDSTEAACEIGSLTHYLDVSGLGRKHHAAENMNKLHKEMAEKGFLFASMEIYDENGDLQGFF